MRFNNNIIAWAKDHDWFHASLSTGELWVVDRYVTADDGKLHEEVIQWTRTVRELRDWAGY